MKFTPMTKEELELASLLPPGIYPFEVMIATDEISKAGNEMIKLKLNVFGDDREAHVWDYLMEKMAFKLRHFAEATDLLADYEAGKMDAWHCVGKQGYCKLAIDQGNGDFPTKNVVKDYIKPEVPMKKPAVSPAAPPSPEIPRKLAPEEFAAKHGIDTGAKFDDDIPFARPVALDGLPF